MKKSFRCWLILLVPFAITLQGCGNDNDSQPCGDESTKPASQVRIFREKPVTISKTIGADGTAGDIERNKWQKVIVEEGPGSFISATISRKGGNRPDSAKTVVRLVLDQKQILVKSFEVARVTGLTQQNNSGIVVLEGDDDIETLVLGFQEPLFFTRMLELSINIEDLDVKKALLSVTFTREDGGEDEQTGGGDKEPDFP